MTVSLVRLAEAEPQPWRNGGGVTRELGRWPVDGDFDWRLSVAEVASDGPFSGFPGVDRILVLLQGDGMTLTYTDDGSTVSLTSPLDTVGFAGERPIDATLHGGPTLDLNLMWRRATRTATCDVLPCADAHEGASPSGLVLIVVGTGSAVLPSGEVLLPGDALVIDDGPVPALRGDASVVRFVLA